MKEAKAAPLYFTRLDSLRFLAFFLVFWQHSFAHSFYGLTDIPWLSQVIKDLNVSGGKGVHIFFVISGFLITFLLIKEEEAKGKINIGAFYVRRILRIWPLYYLVLISGMFILPQIFNTFRFEGSIPMNLLFMNNFDMHDDFANVGVAWSVAIEEQFYLFWPVIFFLLPNKKHLAIFCCIIFLFSSFFIFLNPHHSYFHTFGNLNYLMMGCMGALYYSNNASRVQQHFKSRPALLYMAILLTLLIVATKGLMADIPGFFLLSIFLLPLLYLYFVVYAVDAKDTVKPSLISSLGKYTYGMYLYHPTLLIFLRMAFDRLQLDYLGSFWINICLSVLALIITILFSQLSYEFFEKKILRYKSKFSFVATRV